MAGSPTPTQLAFLQPLEAVETEPTSSYWGQ